MEEIVGRAKRVIDALLVAREAGARSPA